MIKLPMHFEYVPKASNPGIVGFSRIHDTIPLAFGKSFFNEISSTCLPGLSVSNDLKTPL